MRDLIVPGGVCARRGVDVSTASQPYIRVRDTAPVLVCDTAGDDRSRRLRGRLPWIDRLRLLELDLDDAERRRPEPTSLRLKRLRRSMLDDAARVDRQAFRAPWANDAAALADIMSATPQHRSRCIHLDGRLVAFAISGRAAAWGYIQRLAVDPAVQRRGIGRVLVGDAVSWMQRRQVARVLVNTAIDNEAALALYHSAGFDDRPDDLTILERALRA